MAQAYMRRANEGFVNAQRSAIPYAAKSNGYFNKEYNNPITTNYGNNSRSKYGSSALEYTCNNC